MKILIAGGTGFIGKALTDSLVESSNEVNVLSRRKIDDTKGVKHYVWNIEEDYIDPNAFDDVQAIINLTGANIGESRWTKKRKRLIVESRIKPLQLLEKGIRQFGHNIEVLISSSAVGYYGAVTTQEIFEENSANGTDFLAQVCRQWEDEAHRFESLVERVVILRKGVVIAPNGGMIAKIKPLAKLGINIAMGNGRQILPWICLDDLLGVYKHVLQDPGYKGVCNAVSSEYTTINDFSKTLLHSYGRPNLLPNVPGWAVKIIVGELSSMLLQGSRISNEKIKSEGFNFNCSSLEQCLVDSSL